MLTFYDLFRERFRNLDESEKILKQINERLDKSTETVNPEILYPIYYILNTDPCYYWNDSIRKNTLSNLENLNINNSNTIVINNDILNHFFIGYNSYIELSKVIQDLSPINYSNVIKNRMYRIPTYVSIVEGCLTNLLRVIILILDQTTEKDLSAQKKLKPICDALVSKGFEEIIKYIDVDIRNAINHGGILFKEDGKRIEFNYTKGGKVLSKELLDYEFDKLIDNVFDTASGLLLALCQFINNNINLINIDKYENNYVSSNLLCMELSIPSIICKCINESIDSSQLNVHIHIKNTDRDFILQSSLLIAVQVFKRYPNYERYMISFDNERMLTSWARYKRSDLDDILTQKVNIEDVADKLIKSNEIMIWNSSEEDLDLEEIKYYRYPTYKCETFFIKDIKDASLEDRKRLKAHLFIGDADKREDILNIIYQSIEWLKEVKNIASPKFKIKHGDMEAESLYINVYRHDSRKNKELFNNNENFVCFIDYNKNNKTTLDNGGLPVKIWNKYYHEKIKNIRIAWRTNDYLLTNIGRNDTCPCGSEKKYKKCCLL